MVHNVLGELTFLKPDEFFFSPLPLFLWQIVGLVRMKILGMVSPRFADLRLRCALGQIGQYIEIIFELQKPLKHAGCDAERAEEGAEAPAAGEVRGLRLGCSILLLACRLVCGARG